MSKRKKKSKRPVPKKEVLGAFNFGNAFLGAWAGVVLMIIVYGAVALLLTEGVDERYGELLFGAPLIIAHATAAMVGALTRTGRRWGRKFGDYLPLP